VPVAFTTGSVADVRNLPYHAARHWAYGLPRDVALRAVTLTPAEILGLGQEMGSIAPGRRADLVLTDGDLLQITTRVERLWIGGEEVDPEANKHFELYQEFRDRH
jgi:imidazolonepropionase-like amidohydrolase